jgi:hypothetical protein
MFHSRDTAACLARVVVLASVGCTSDLDGKGETPSAVDPPTEEEVEDYVTNGPLDLAPGSSVGGESLATEEDLADLSWSDLDDIPEELLDGDDDTLSGLTCGEGEWLSSVGGAWTCTSTLPPERVDSSVASDGDVLVVTGGEAGWVPLDEVVPAPGCPSGMVQTGDFCVETSVRSAQTWQDAVLDCASAGAHLCFHAELVPGCVAGTTSVAPSGLEWTSDRTGNGQAAMAFGPTYACDATTESIGNAREYRCCTAAR